MSRGWKRLGSLAALVVATNVVPGSAQNTVPEPASQKGSDFKRQPDDGGNPRQELEQLRRDVLRSFQAAQKEMEALKEENARLRKDLDDLRNAPPSSRDSKSSPPKAGSTLAALQADIDALREEVSRLRKDLDDARAARTAPRVSAYPPDVAGTGSILLLNSYRAEVTIIVNGERYPLAPGERRLLSGQPTGVFTYEVIGVQPPVERTLDARSPFSIHVHP